MLLRALNNRWPLSHIWQNLKKRALNRPSYKKYIFIVGSPRSGTTLLHSLISEHTDICACRGESAIFTLQDLMNADRKYCGISKDVISKILESTASQVELMDAVASHVCGDERIAFVEKTPAHVFQLSNLVHLFPEALFLNIYRDGRDCYCSSKSNKYVIQNRSVKQFATYWKKSIQARRRVRSGRIIDVYYEKLVRSPERVLEKVMLDLGYRLQPEQLRFWENSADPRAKTNAFRKLSAPIDDGSIGRWKSELSEAENNTFVDIAGVELKMLEYM